LKYKKSDGKIVHAFYRKNEETEKWISANREKSFVYFDEANCDSFNDFILDFKMIVGFLTKQQRTDLFLSLSKGRPVTGVDKLKNYYDIPIVKFITDRSWENKMKNIIRRKIAVKADRYWLHWLIRMYVLYTDTSSASFLLKDREITEMMKTKSDKIKKHNPDSKFQENVESFFEFLDKIDFEKVCKLSPTRLYVLYCILLADNSDNRKTILLSQSYFWDEYQTKKERMMWENRGTTDKERGAYFEKLLSEMSAYNEIAKTVPERVNIPKPIKDAVWRQYCGDKKDGKCYCCKVKITDANTQYGHVRSVRYGGQNTVDNLRPVCSGCNQSMGSQNMDSWMEKNGMEINSS
jgi:hypothetical protein